MMNDKIQEEINGLHKIKERVVWIFNRHPETIQSDNSLVSKYKIYFGSPNAQTINTLSRASRNLRSKYPTRYCRNREVLEGSQIKEKANKIYWRD